MSNKKLFSSSRSSNVKAADVINNAGGLAYSRSDEASLAQLVMTGCFNGTYYTSDKDQLDNIAKYVSKCSDEFIAKLAVFARQQGLMKDTPAFLLAVLAARNVPLLKKVFFKVINDPKMLRNFVQIVRSGQTGRKSFGTAVKRLIQTYLSKMTDEQLFNADVGNNPSLQDIIKMVHPKPENKSRAAMYSYLLDREYNKNDILPLVNHFESFKKGEVSDLPKVPFQKLTALSLTKQHWEKIAENATWNQIRMNLNTFARHNVLTHDKLVANLAAKLSDEEQVRKSKVFPYALFNAYLNTQNIPSQLSLALQKALELSTKNIPVLKGNTYILVDTSGSMSSPITGYRGSVTSKVRCIDVAALMACSIMRVNPQAQIIPFDIRVHSHNLNPMDAIVTNAEKLAAYGGGGTDCSVAMAHLNQLQAKADLVLLISDNESWQLSSNRRYGDRGTDFQHEWQKLKNRCPNVKLVNLDLTPNLNIQTETKSDILNIGGFNDTVFEVIASFLNNSSSSDYWLQTINQVEI